jgi:hypothetical protein
MFTSKFGGTGHHGTVIFFHGYAQSIFVNMVNNPPTCFAKDSAMTGRQDGHLAMK